MDDTVFLDADDTEFVATVYEAHVFDATQIEAARVALMERFARTMDSDRAAIATEALLAELRARWAEGHEAVAVKFYAGDGGPPENATVH